MCFLFLLSLLTSDVLFAGDHSHNIEFGKAVLRTLAPDLEWGNKMVKVGQDALSMIQPPQFHVDIATVNKMFWYDKVIALFVISQYMLVHCDIARVTNICGPLFEKFGLKALLPFIICNGAALAYLLQR